VPDVKLSTIEEKRILKILLDNKGSKASITIFLFGLQSKPDVL